MVNGNYVLYGDRPSSESEIVDDHVHRTVDRKTRRKAHRTANELQSSLNKAQLDNDTDSVKYEKRVQEPKLLRYVPTTDVEENFVSDKFETYDLKPTEEKPRRYAFTKKPKNPADGSVNYAYSRSSSSCSSPNGNLPTISEHSEQYGSYRVRPISVVEDLSIPYESKLEKYFTRHREIKTFAAKGSHPDSLYRVSSGGSAGAGKAARALRILRWPAALVVVCVALAVFVYFLMPDNLDSDQSAVNGSYWSPVTAGVGGPYGPPSSNKKNNTTTHEIKRTEIDFYEADSNKSYDSASSTESDSDANVKRKLPIPPVFPSHITPEVQYGNEKADVDKMRNPKLLEETNTVPEDSTLKPHITQKPEKPLAIYFKDGNGIATSSATETIVKAETINDYSNYGDKINNKETSVQPLVQVYNHLPIRQENKERPVAPVYENNFDIPPEIQEFYRRRTEGDVNFTSGHSKLFGISIEDAEKMKATTQSSTYNTRVSPTLPTWRDGDDTTTKKYPLNVNYDVPQCHSTRLALCRDVLPYDLAGPAVSAAGGDLLALLPQVEYVVGSNCSERVRSFVCALLEPECNPPPYPPRLPCYNLCRSIMDRCDELVPQELAPWFRCNQYGASNCVEAKAPCSLREFTCSDGSCVPRDWICDGTRDCPAGEDEAKCVSCDTNEFRCEDGGCIRKEWVCDGYKDCALGEDESDQFCASRRRIPIHDEPGEESAGSAPAPAIRKPSRIPTPAREHRGGDYDTSKELLMTSDSTNALRRNFTRRPSLSRLSPYSRPHLKDMRNAKPQAFAETVDKRSKHDDLDKEQTEQYETIKKPKFERKKTNDKKEKADSIEDIDMGELGLFDDSEKDRSTKGDGSTRETELNPKKDIKKNSRPESGMAPLPEPESDTTHLDKTLNKFQRVIDGASLLKKASADHARMQEPEESMEVNGTLQFEARGAKYTTPIAIPPEALMRPGSHGSQSSHASPCPSGELRCVDGRCITLDQLCDGTIDCSDHADEDNCFT